MDEQNLQQLIESEIGHKNISRIVLPEYITSNLKHDLWYWQKEALQYFLAYDDPEYEYEKPANEPTHLMFNMATGTGKTMLMAALILYYYKKGHRHFIFFVNQNNIVDKTENNFINKQHNKYEFKQNIVIDDKTINIKKVERFDDSQDIQIKFTSIHKLHNDVYLAKENSVTLDELQKQDLIMFGDEAHHLNASTMKNGQTELELPTELKENASEKDIEKSWEDTVLNKILRGGKANKALLEFTATIPKNTDVIEKYRTKTIFRFELVDFLNAGYTKEINIVSSSLKKQEKILLALLFNWYRHQIALRNNIPNFKPVILFRSKLIEDSKKDYKDFIDLITGLRPADLDFLKSVENSIKEDQSSLFKAYEQGKSRIKQMLAFIKEEKISIGEIVNYIKAEFAERNCIITNSKDSKLTTKEKTTEEQEQLLNSLEDKNNHIRAIFTVKRLTEGWDVLNLYDIVRLYEGERDETKESKTGKRKAGEATVQEIQLIGRGVRYFPFAYNEHERNRRKFDENLNNPMRILEEFYFHSSGKDSEKERRYIDELKRELKNQGYIKDNRVIKKFALKDEFKSSDFFREIRVWKNERIDNPAKKRKTLTEMAKSFVFEYKISDFVVKEQQVVLDKEKDEVLAESKQKDRKTITVNFSDFEKHIVNKAINIKATKDLSLMRFDHLRDELNISSVDDIFSNDFIGDFRINIVTSKDKDSLDKIGNGEKLNLLMSFFEAFMKKLKEISNPYKGTEKFEPFSFAELFGEEKEKSVLIDQESKNLESELLQNKWYILNGFNGTSEERGLLEFMKKKIGNLTDKYSEVYLLRNEEVYKIFDFDQGRGFEPDFLLFLKGKKSNLYYQVFIEPKGEQFVDKEGGFKESREGWKEDFLKQITDRYGAGSLLKAENKDYKLIGLPLFNKLEENIFEGEFGNKVLN